jgi:RNA 2',3'-cyclic 3'-phosphodiesterase
VIERAFTGSIVHDLFYSLDEQAIMSRVLPPDRLFLAIVPPLEAAIRISAVATILKQANGFTAKLTEPACLHVSLFFLGGLPDEVVQAACEAAADVQAAPFEISFDRSVSFRGAAGGRPFVLMGDNSVQPVRSFRRVLGAALSSVGLKRRVNRGFMPHMTLLYDERIAEELPIEPISWVVNDFVLIHSRYGHTHLARWPLRA